MSHKLELLELVLEWAFGFSLLLMYSILSHTIAVRQVTETNSYGLPIILNSLSGLGGAWGVLIVARRKERKNVIPFPTQAAAPPQTGVAA